uniref:CLIP domain-containing serine protease n=1 Tax=Anopheles braziliensis TaxID=58242 RepID=A0A2M3ZE90_9DIPT
MDSSRSLGAVIVVSTLVSVVWGSVCQTSSGTTTGTCVEIDKCSNWTQIVAQLHLSREELELLSDASAACSVSSDGMQTLCCTQEDIRNNRSEPTVLDPPQCLNGLADPPQTETTSFGALICIHDQGQNLSKRCVGSLIDADHVLTSAQCVHQIPIDTITVYVNARNVAYWEDGSVSSGVVPFYVTSVIIPPEYSPGQLGYDIALLRLKKTVQISSSESQTPQPICIPTSEKHYESENPILYSFGWGSNAEGVLSDIKQSVMLKRISLPQCVKMGGRLKVMSEVLIASNKTNPICTIDIGIPGLNLFQGYTGAPLMYRQNGAWFLRGVIGTPLNSEDVQNSERVNRVLSTSVQYHAKWIEDVLKSIDA